MKNIFAIALVFFSFFAKCQSNFTTELDFLFHLTENKLIDDAVFYGNKLLKSDQYTESQKDTINYFLGRLLVASSADTLAPKYLNAISINSNFYYFGRFNEVDQYLKQKRTDTAFARVAQIDSSTSEVINQLINFEKAGLYLYHNQQKKFDSLAMFFRSPEADLHAEQQSMLQYGEINRKLKRKSPFVAGMLSAIVPGLGKVYAGNNGQAIASFLSVGLIGGIAVENYIKQGITHPQTIIFGVITSVFYIGNIWGSALSVQLIRNEKNLENKNNILVSLRMPLHKFFK